MSNRLWAAVAALTWAWGALAACPSVPTEDRFMASDAQVTDRKTGLVWARCSVGQVWDGATCAGEATRHWHWEALELAQATTGWRLPSIKELSSLSDKGCLSPAIDRVAFPNTASTWYWSSTPYAGFADSAWNVNFNAVTVTAYSRLDRLAVRLVRSGR